MPSSRRPHRARTRVPPNKIDLLFVPADGLDDDLDFGVSRQVRDLSPNSAPTVKSLAGSKSNCTASTAAATHGNFGPDEGEWVSNLSPPSAPITKPGVAPNLVRTSVKKSSAATEAPYYAVCAQIKPPRPQEYIIIFQDANPSSRSTAKAAPVIKKITKTTVQSKILNARKSLQTPFEKLLATASRLHKKANSKGPKLPHGLIVIRKPFYTDHDRQIQQSRENYMLGRYEYELPKRIEEIANVRLAPLPSLRCISELEGRQRQDSFALLYGEDAKPFQDFERSNEEISMEIVRLYVHEDMKMLQPFLQDFQMDLRFHMQKLEESMHAYRKAVRQEGEAQRLVEIGQITRVEDLRAAYNLSKDIIWQPWRNQKSSGGEVWVAATSLFMFRKSLNERIRKAKVSRQEEHYKKLFDKAVNLPMELTEHYKDMFERFSAQFPNHHQRDRARAVKHSASSLRLAIKSLEAIQAQYGIVHTTYDRSVPWSLRKNIHLLGQLVQGDCSNMSRDASIYESDMLLFREGFGGLNRILSWFKPDLEYLLSWAKDSVQRHGRALRRELTWSSMFERQVQDLIDSIMSGTERPYPIILRSQMTANEDRNHFIRSIGNQNAPTTTLLLYNGSTREIEKYMDSQLAALTRSYEFALQVSRAFPKADQLHTRGQGSPAAEISQADGFELYSDDPTFRNWRDRCKAFPRLMSSDGELSEVPKPMISPIDAVSLTSKLKEISTSIDLLTADFDLYMEAQPLFRRVCVPPITIYGMELRFRDLKSQLGRLDDEFKITTPHYTGDGTTSSVQEQLAADVIRTEGTASRPNKPSSKAKQRPDSVSIRKRRVLPRGSTRLQITQKNSKNLKSRVVEEHSRLELDAPLAPQNMYDAPASKTSKVPVVHLGDTIEGSKPTALSGA